MMSSASKKEHQVRLQLTENLRFYIQRIYNNGLIRAELDKIYSAKTRSVFVLLANRPAKHMTSNMKGALCKFIL